MATQVLLFSRKTVAFLLLLSAVFVLGCTGPKEREEIRLSNDPHRPIMRIDGEPVAEREIQWRLETRYNPLEIDTADPERKRAMIQVAVEEVIVDKLLLKAALQTDLQVDAAEVDGAIQTTRDMVGDARFQEMLAQRYTSEEDYREFVKRILIIGRYEEKLYADVKVDEASLAQFFEGHKESFMLPETVRLEVLLVPDRAMADQIHSRLQGGEVFQAVLDAYSAGNEKVKGSRMSWIPYDRIPEALREAVRSGEAGEVLAPIQTSEGSTVIRILEKRPPHLPSLADARKDVEALALKEQKHAILQAWYDEARKKASIEYLN
jgi:parvulin-like peptidyl-prolyl isomerase